MQIIIRRIDLHLKFIFNFIQFSMSPLHAVCTRNTKWKHRVFETRFPSVAGGFLAQPIRLKSTR